MSAKIILIREEIVTAHEVWNFLRKDNWAHTLFKSSKDSFLDIDTADCYVESKNYKDARWHFPEPEGRIVKLLQSPHVATILKVIEIKNGGQLKCFNRESCNPLSL